MALPPQRRKWSWFSVGVGVVLLGLCALDPSTAALAVGVLLVLGGVVGLLIPS